MARASPLSLSRGHLPSGSWTLSGPTLLRGTPQELSAGPREHSFSMAEPLPPPLPKVLAPWYLSQHPEGASPALAARGAGRESAARPCSGPSWVTRQLPPTSIPVCDLGGLERITPSSSAFWDSRAWSLLPRVHFPKADRLTTGREPDFCCHLRFPEIRDAWGLFSLEGSVCTENAAPRASQPGLRLVSSRGRHAKGQGVRPSEDAPGPLPGVDIPYPPDANSHELKDRASPTHPATGQEPWHTFCSLCTPMLVSPGRQEESLCERQEPCLRAPPSPHSHPLGHTSWVWASVYLIKR